jgi:hypothetical protein
VLPRISQEPCSRVCATRHCSPYQPGLREVADQAQYALESTGLHCSRKSQSAWPVQGSKETDKTMRPS